MWETDQQKVKTTMKLYKLVKYACILSKTFSNQTERVLYFPFFSLHESWLPMALAFLKMSMTN